MELYFLNYADDRFMRKGGHFRENQIRLNESAKKQGISNIVSWIWDDLIKTEFYANYKEYLNKHCKENGYVWKPFIILELLKKIKYGDMVFYYDCGPYLINRSVWLVVKLCIRNRGTVFHQCGEKNSKWTKRDAFVYMGCDEPKYHNGVALQATWIFFQKNDFNINFVEEWLKYNLDERIASSQMPNTCGLPNLPGFVENRRDQSILTNLAIKYNIKTFFGAGGYLNKHIDNFIYSLSVKGKLEISGRRVLKKTGFADIVIKILKFLSRKCSTSTKKCLRKYGIKSLNTTCNIFKFIF
jgi:hypothetical protein